MTADEPVEGCPRTDAEIEQFIRDAWEGHDPNEPWEPDTPEQIAERAETAELFWPLQCEAIALMDEIHEAEMTAHEEGAREKAYLRLAFYIAVTLAVVLNVPLTLLQHDARVLIFVPIDAVAITAVLWLTRRKRRR